MARVIGGKAFAAKLKRLSGPEAVRQIDAALFAGGQILETEAALSITNGSVSGANHIASLPGEPPNNDTGVLVRNIETVVVRPLRVEVSSNAPYSTALEFGTSKMAERPFMRPAAAKARPEVAKLIRLAVDRLNRGGKVTG